MFVVTGGGSGIGKALAQALAHRHQSVLIVGRREACLRDVAQRSDLITYVCADVSTSSGRDVIVDRLESCPAIKGVNHNAGVIEPMIPLASIDEDEWRHVMATNLDAPLFLTQRLQHLLSGGRVLNIGSGAAYFPVLGWGAYCVSKSALATLTRCYQFETSDIAFAYVMPGIIDTPMQADIRQAVHMEDKQRQFYQQMYQAHHLISPETVAHFLCWLLLDTEKTQFVSQEWDIYDTTHHSQWLFPPHSVPPLE